MAFITLTDMKDDSRIVVNTSLVEAIESSVTTAGAAITLISGRRICASESFQTVMTKIYDANRQL